MSFWYVSHLHKKTPSIVHTAVSNKAREGLIFCPSLHLYPYSVPQFLVSSAVFKVHFWGPISTEFISSMQLKVTTRSLNHIKRRPSGSGVVLGILGQVWYLIVSIPDLCTLTLLILSSYMRRAKNQWLSH